MICKQQNSCGLIVAAGLSSRMGDFKPLMPLRGKTLIENTVDSVLNGGGESVVVVTGYRGDELENLLESRYGDKIRCVRNDDFASTDMMHSIQKGCQALSPCVAFFLLPGDMPLVQPSTFHTLLMARPKDEVSVVFPTLKGYLKHPPLIDARLIPKILAFKGRGGLREFWKEHPEWIHSLPIDDSGIWVDVDTQQDYLLCKHIYE